MKVSSGQLQSIVGNGVHHILSPLKNREEKGLKSFCEGGGMKDGIISSLSSVTQKQPVKSQRELLHRQSREDGKILVKLIHIVTKQP